VKIVALKAMLYVRGAKKPTMKQQFDVTHRCTVLQMTGGKLDIHWPTPSARNFFAKM
jgi:hypothetical protein